VDFSTKVTIGKGIRLLKKTIRTVPTVTIRKLKSTQSIVKPIAFFYGIVTNKLKELFLNQLFEVRESKPLRYVLQTGEVMYYDWLHG
jgi:hypothetical protein